MRYLIDGVGAPAWCFWAAAGRPRRLQLAHSELEFALKHHNSAKLWQFRRKAFEPAHRVFYLTGNVEAGDETPPIETMIG
jgi:hypothetical protein